jgi:flagellar hook assembly protein FlgD
MVGLIISNGEEIHENGHAVSSLQIIASYPNPFSKTVNLRYQIRSAGIVIARIINGLGQDVKYNRREYACPGVHSISWNGKNDAEIQQPHGVYLIILEFNGRRVYSNLIYCAP